MSCRCRLGGRREQLIVIYRFRGENLGVWNLSRAAAERPGSIHHLHRHRQQPAGHRGESTGRHQLHNGQRLGHPPHTHTHGAVLQRRTFASSTGPAGDDAPRDLQANDVTPRAAVLSWKPPSMPVSGYRLTYQTEGQDTKVGSE